MTKEALERIKALTNIQYRISDIIGEELPHITKKERDEYFKWFKQVVAPMITKSLIKQEKVKRLTA